MRIHREYKPSSLPMDELVDLLHRLLVQSSDTDLTVSDIEKSTTLKADLLFGPDRVRDGS